MVGRATGSEPNRAHEGPKSLHVFHRLAALITLTYVLTRVPFVYTLGAPDRDQGHMALGTLDALWQHTGLSGRHLYGASFSFGYYTLLFGCGDYLRATPHAIFALMSGIGVLFGGLALLAFVYLLRRLMGDAAGLLGGVCLLFHPGWWELTTYGHPNIVAVGLFIPGCLALAHAMDAGGGSKWVWLALSGVLYALTLTVRADWLLAAAVFPALAYARGVSAKRAIVTGGGVVGIALVLFEAAHTAAFPGTSYHEFGSRAASVLSPSLSLTLKNLVVFVMGTGLALMAAVVAGILVAAARRRWRLLLLVGAGAVPPMLWWLQVGGPWRHFLLAGIMLLIPLASCVSGWHWRRVLTTAVALMALNEASQALAFPIVSRSYAWSYRIAPGARRWTPSVVMGDWFSNHAAGQAHVRREATEARWLADLRNPRLLVVEPRPFRAQLELIARAPRYVFCTDSLLAGAELGMIQTPGRRTVFLDTEPAQTQAAVDGILRKPWIDSYWAYLSPMGELERGSYPRIGLPRVFPPPGVITDGM